MEKITATSRNYRDLYSYKTLVHDVLIPKYFPTDDVSTLNVGLLGLITELTGITTEDTFYTVSTMLREFFPNKAILPESIYSYAGLFQLSKGMGKAASCRFLLLLSEQDMLKEFDQSELSTGVATNRIYISKNTQIYLGEIPFTLDYDIELTRKKTKLRKSSQWSYGAKYVTAPYRNSISSIANPYIKIRKSTDGFIALEIEAHQCIRTELPEETIVENSSINYTEISVPFTGVLAGFDVFYKAPEEENFSQLDTLVVDSLPQKDPFCYYKVADEDLLKISFAMTSSYFQPEFNSEIKVVIYTCSGEDGNFEYYSGTDITVVQDNDSFSYEQNFIVGAVVVGSSVNGSSATNLEDLRKIVVQSFGTANAMTTDNDIEEFFYAYAQRANNQVKFIKRRDDLSERLYSGYFIMRNNDYIYPTNTLDMDVNYHCWENVDGGYIYTLDPGHVFEYDGSRRRVVPLYVRGFMDKKEFINFQGQSVYEWIYRDYFNWLSKVEPSSMIGFDKNDADWKTNWIHSKTTGKTFRDFLATELCTCDECGFHTFDVVDEDGEIRCPVCHSAHITKGGLSPENFMSTVFDDDPRFLEKTSNGEFLFSNPFLMSITKTPGILNYFLTIINQTSLMDFKEYNEETPLQFIINKVRVYRDLSREKEYTVRLEMMTSIEWDIETLIPGITMDTYVPRRSQLKNNYLRTILIIQNGGVDVCYIEMVPEFYSDDDHIVFACRFRVNDHVTMAHETQLSEYSDEELGYIPDGVDAPAHTEFTFDEREISNIFITDEKVSFVKADVSEEGKEPESSSGVGDGEETERPDTSGIHGNFVLLENRGSWLIPMTDVVMKVVVLTKDYEKADSKQITDNYPNDKRKFGLEGYQWTNVYDTSTDKVDLIKPLNMIRSSMYYRDNRLYNVQDGDVYLYSVPFIKYSLMQHFDTSGNYVKDSSGFTNYEMFTKFITDYLYQYENMETALSTTIRTASHIDLKFYNTYGKSKNYLIGDSDEVIDRVNMSICFYVYIVAGTDMVKAMSDLKTFIKDTIESLNQYGSNDMNISNLIRKIENNFAYVDHLRFIGINGEVINGEYKRTSKMGYSTEYQTIRNIATDLDDLSTDERFSYVPEMLCINKDQISLVIFEV